MSKYSLYLWFGGKIPMKERLKAIKEAGFDSVAILYSDEYANTLGKKEDIVKQIYEENLEIENFHLPYLNAFDIFSDDLVKANKIYDLYLSCIQDASFYKVKTCVIHLTGDIVSYPINKNGFKLLEDLIKKAKELNVNLAFENLRKEGLLYLNTFLDTHLDDNVGFCYDYGHDHCFNNENELEILKKYKDRLFALHLHGNDGLWDYHRRLRDGNGDLVKLKEVLNTIDLKSPLALEVIQNPSFNNYEELLKYVLEMKEDLISLER